MLSAPVGSRALTAGQGGEVIPTRIYVQFGVLTLFVVPSPLLGQSTLRGVVRHDSTGAPLAGVEVILNNTPHHTETSADGRYLLEGLPAGVYQTIFRKVGHLPVRIDVRLVTGETTRANTTLIESAVVLNPVIVTGTPETSRGVGVGREAFEERRKMGFGKFFDEEYIRRLDATHNLDDLLTRDAGIAVRMVKIEEGLVRVAMNRRRLGENLAPTCYMQIYYNGVAVGRGGVAGVSRVDPPDLRSWSLSGLESVEVYRSAAEVPVEYGGATGGCGVILLWSRVNP